jgi:Rne/Rng family ribonuclease
VAEAQEVPADDEARSRRGGRSRDEAVAPPTAATPELRTPDARTADVLSADDDAPRSRRRPTRRPDDSLDEAPADVPARTETTDTADDAGRRGRRAPRGRESTLESRAETGTPEAQTTDDQPVEARSTEARPAEPRREGTRGDSARGEGRRSEGRETPAGPRAPGARRVPIPSNEQLLRRGGNVIVKITKEPISAKGSRVSTDISLAGRFLVLVPAADYVAVSKKIESAKERRRLRTLAQSLKPDNCGVIVRTVAEGRDAKSLDTDLRLLIDKWRQIEARLDGGRAKAPVLLYEDVNMVSSIIRDLFSEDFDRILVDDPKTFRNVQAYVQAVAPDMADKVELHRGTTPAFRAAGIDKQVEEAFSRRVNLKSGGYLFIETTEAMHVVDVNSGRAGRGKSQKENMIAVNVEAAREVAKQLRLRDLGGIIVVDFIDLRLESDRRKVTNVLTEAFAKDRAVTKLLPMSDFGLVQITRQRLRPSITAQPDEDEGTSADPAARAERAGAGEIAQAPGRRSRDDDRGGRGLDAGPVDLADAASADERPARRGDRSRDAGTRETGSRDAGPRDERPSRRTREPRAADAAFDDVQPEVAASPESATALLRGWLDNYRRSVDEAYRLRPVIVRVHPLFLTHLQRGLFSALTRWRFSIRDIPWRIEEDAALDPLAFDVRDEKSGRSLLRKYTL